MCLLWLPSLVLRICLFCITKLGFVAEYLMHLLLDLENFVYSVWKHHYWFLKNKLMNKSHVSKLRCFLVISKNFTPLSGNLIPPSEVVERTLFFCYFHSKEGFVRFSYQVMFPFLYNTRFGVKVASEMRALTYIKFNYCDFPE